MRDQCPNDQVLGGKRAHLPPPGTEGGFRLYRPSEVVRLSFIKDLQAFNYTLAEIGNILRLAGPDLGATDADLEGMSSAEVEKLQGALEFLIGRMREVRDASSRVESVFSRASGGFPGPRGPGDGLKAGFVLPAVLDARSGFMVCSDGYSSSP